MKLSQHKSEILRTLQTRIETIFNTSNDISKALSIVYNIEERDNILFGISQQEDDLIFLDDNYDKIVKKIQTRYTNYNKYYVEPKEKQQQEENLCAVLTNVMVQKQEQEQIEKEQQKKEERKRSWQAFFMLLGLIIKYIFVFIFGTIYFIFKVIEGMSKK